MSVARASTMFMPPSPADDQRVPPSPESSSCGLDGGRSGHTSTARNQRGVPRTIAFNDRINILTAQKTAPPVFLAGAPQLPQLGGNHQPLAARTMHRHWIYFPFWQISTVAFSLPSRGLIIWSIPLCSGALLKNVANSSSGNAFSTMVVSPLNCVRPAAGTPMTINDTSSCRNRRITHLPSTRRGRNSYGFCSLTSGRRNCPTHEIHREHQGQNNKHIRPQI